MTDVIMFDGGSNVHLGCELFKIHYFKVIVIRGVEHAVYLFFSDISKIPILNCIITAQKEI